MPRGFDGARFVHGNVPGLSSNHALVTGEQCRKNHRVGLRSAREEEYVGLGCLASFANALGGAGAETVGAVAWRGLEIRRGQRLQDERMCAGGIVVLKGNHGASSGVLSVCRKDG